jgi:hypothetical protein
MNFELGVPKGMRLVLEETGVDVTGMGAEEMRSVLVEMEDLSMKVPCSSLFETKGAFFAEIPPRINPH